MLGKLHWLGSRSRALRARRSRRDQLKTLEALGWRPFTQKRPALTLLIILPTIFIIVLAVLLWRNARLGGVVFATNGNQFSDVQIFWFRYLPIIVTVLYSLCWGWLDLDTKRLEPYYQLARAGGVSAKESLLLQYPSTFFAFVPYISFRARHWVVFAVSMVSIITNWAAIPLQNGVFTTRPLMIDEPIQVSQPYQLIPLAMQNTRMSMAFLRDTSSVLWLGQKLPSFTTQEFALAPVDIPASFTGFNQSIRIRTMLYESDFTCKPPANISMLDNYYTFDDGHGCSAEQVIRANSTSTIPKFQAYHIAHEHKVIIDPRFSSGLSDTACPGNNNVFLAWRRTTSSQSDFDNPDNATALFCSSIFHSQLVEVILEGPDHTITSYQRLGERYVLPETQFNSTRFHYMMAVGGLPPVEAGEFMEDKKLGQGAFVSNMSLLIPINTAVGFAIGSSHLIPEAYMNATNLANAYRSAYRLAFALSVRNLFEPSTDTAIMISTKTTMLEVVAVVPIFAISVQIILAISAAFSIYLFFTVPRRPSHLERDPDCIGESMLIAIDPMVRQAGRDMHPESVANPLFQDDARFSLSNMNLTDHPMLNVHLSSYLENVPAKHGAATKSYARTLTDSLWVSSTSIEPMEYKWYLGFGVCTMLTGMLTSLFILRMISEKQGGLVLPSSNEIILQIVINILPTSIATIMEPIWVWITRMACILAPLENIQANNEPAKRSPMLRYAAIPPQLTAWQAFKNRNLVLGLLSTVAFTSGLLTVVVSGILVIVPTTMSKPMSIPALYSGQLEEPVVFLGAGGSYEEYWVTLANITNRTSLPTWTSPHNFFIPVQLDSLATQPDFMEIALTAIGYSVDPRCSPLTRSTTVNNTYELDLGNDATQMIFTTSHLSEDGRTFRCAPQFNDVPPLSDVINTFTTERTALSRTYEDPLGVQMMRVGNALNPLFLGRNSTSIPLNSSDATYSVCNEMLIFGGIRVNASFISNSTTSNLRSEMEISSGFMTCRPRVMMQTFNIAVSTQGHILAATPLSEESSRLPPGIDYTSVVTDIIYTFDSATGMDGNPGWFNDSTPTTLVDGLQIAMTNSTSFLDPELPLMPIERQIPIVEDIIRRVFAIKLRLSLRQFTPASRTAAPVQAQVKTIERRIFVSPLPLTISIVILSFQLFVAVLFFSTRPRPFLKRLPTNLAAQIALFANSHVVEDVISTTQGDFRELDRRGWKYGYGRFIGVDGKPEEGIERDVFLTKLGARPTGFQKSMQALCGVLRRKKPSRQSPQEQVGTQQISHSSAPGPLWPLLSTASTEPSVEVVVSSVLPVSPIHSPVRTRSPSLRNVSEHSVISETSQHFPMV